MTVFEINTTSRIYCGLKNEERFCALKPDLTNLNQEVVVNSFKKYAFDKDQNDLVNLNTLDLFRIQIKMRSFLHFHIRL